MGISNPVISGRRPPDRYVLLATLQSEGTTLQCLVIETFKSKALKLFWLKGDASKLPAASLPRITIYLTALQSATRPEDLDLPGYYFHKLTNGRYSVRVTGNWRVTFGWEAPDAINVDFEDYH